MSNKTAIIYCRVSTDKQGQNGDSLDIQEKECRSYCERMHIDVVEVFRDQFTGTSIQRPALIEAIKYLKKEKKSIDYCIIHKIDRSTRGGLGDYYEIKRQLEENGTQLKDAYGVIQDDIRVVNIDNFDAGIYDWAKINPSEIAVSMTVLSAKQERSSILQRTIPQEIRNTQNGYISRQPHIGYQNQKVCTDEGKLKTTYIAHPEESKWIHAMFELRAQGGLSDKDITQLVNMMGFHTRSMKIWNKEHTMIVGDMGNKELDVKLLQNYIQKPIYAGIICEKWTGNKPVRGKFEGIVSINLFNLANRGKIEIVESKEGTLTILYGNEKLPEKVIAQRASYNSEYPFSKVIQCPHCKGFLTPNKCRSRNGSYHHYYQCNGKGGVKHKNYTERRDELNETVTDFLSRISFNTSYMEKVLDKIDEIWKQRSREIEIKKMTLQKEIESLEDTKNRITKNIEKFIEFPEILKAKNEELISINQKLNSLKTEKIDDDNQKSKDGFIEFTKNILKHISKMLQEEKNEESIGVVFDILFEKLPTYENIQSQTTFLYPVFALQSKNHTIDDVTSGFKDNENVLWQSHLELNQDLRLWRPLH